MEFLLKSLSPKLLLGLLPMLLVKVGNYFKNSLQMFPRFSIENIFNRLPAYTITLGKCRFAVSVFIGNIRFTYFKDFFLGQFTLLNGFATRCVTSSSFGWDLRISTFLGSVNSIILRCAEKKMVRANAVPNVALVANQQTNRDFAKGELISEPMRSNVLPFAGDFSVTVGRDLASPKPTSISFFNLLPKPGSKIFNANFIATRNRAKLINVVLIFGDKLLETVSANVCYFFSSHFVFSYSENALVRLD